MNITISWTEPPGIKSAFPEAVFNTMPEDYGVDILAELDNGNRAGVQRKEVKDLLASLTDNRLNKEFLQWADLDHVMLVVEGPILWTNQHPRSMSLRYTNMSERQWNGLMWSIQSMGIFTVSTKDKAGTAQVSRDWFKWLSKEEHTSLYGRKDKIVPKSKFGQITKADHQAHLLTSINGIGIGIARKIVEEFGGVPFSLTDDAVERLSKIAGIGKGKVELIRRVFE